MEIANMIKHTG